VPLDCLLDDFRNLGAITAGVGFDAQYAYRQ
jgi:hypothetical protein